MFKFKNIGTFDVAHNIPYCKTPVVLKNGYGVTYDEATKTVALPTSTTAKGKLAIVYNLIDKPEIKNPDDYTIEIGEYPRLIALDSIDSHIVVMNATAIKTDVSTLIVGDKLIVGTDGLWTKGAVDGYTQYLEVTALVSYNGKGIEAKVVNA
jgi:hypothetical protein